MPRPELNRQTTPGDFLSFYWLKDELIRFLRAQGLSATGSKAELTNRISRFLETGTVENNAPRKTAKRTDMPATLTRQSMIGPGWRCSQELRAFFEREIGPHFHFDGVMRDFIHNGVGKTLQEAIETWEAEQRNPRQEKPIAPQFEYNRHVREYFKAHPSAPLAEAIQDWKSKKQDQRSTKYEIRKELP
jgi:hypothetical protein